MSNARPVLMAVAIMSALAFVVPAQARAHQYPYTLVDPGTFGGPNSYINGPAIPLTTNGSLLGSADTTTLDTDYPNFNAFMFQDPDLGQAFLWRAGRLQKLGALPGNNDSTVFEMNGNGVGVGASETSVADPFTGSPSEHAVLFKNGEVRDLGTLPGGYESQATAINDAGLVAGFALNGIPDAWSSFFVGPSWTTQLRTFAWRNGAMRDIGTLGGPDSAIADLNTRGQIAGSSLTNSTPNASTTVPTIHPYLWQNGHMRDLGTLGGTLATASWMNDAGEVVGQSTLTGDQQTDPFLWDGSKMIDLGGFGGGYGGANWINQRGDVVGASYTQNQNFDGFLWRDGQLSDLPPVGGAVNAFPQSVNNRDQVVGEVDDANFNPIIAALWTGGHAYDLNTLIASSSLQLTSANYIDEQGDIVGSALLPDGTNREFLLIRNPSVPLPASMAGVARARQSRHWRHNRLTGAQARWLMHEFGPPPRIRHRAAL